MVVRPYLTTLLLKSQIKKSGLNRYLSPSSQLFRMLPKTIVFAFEIALVTRERAKFSAIIPLYIRWLGVMAEDFFIFLFPTSKRKKETKIQTKKSRKCLLDLP